MRRGNLRLKHQHVYFKTRRFGMNRQMHLVGVGSTVRSDLIGKNSHQNQANDINYTEKCPQVFQKFFVDNGLPQNINITF